MLIHIGEEVHKVVQKKKIRAKIVAEGINVSESTIYKLYKRETIDIDKLIRLSQFLNTNFFLHYIEEEPLKSMFNQKNEELKSEIKNLKETLALKDKRIKELTSNNSSLQKAISLLEKSNKK